MRRHKDVLADQLQATRAAHAQDLRHFQDMEQALAVASSEYISLARRCGAEAEASTEAHATSGGDGEGGEGGGGGGGGGDAGGASSSLPGGSAMSTLLGQAAARQAAGSAAAGAEGGPLSPERGVRAGSTLLASSPPEMARSSVPRPACG